MTTLVVTNDFPPRIGGIESFVAAACELLDHDVVVLTSGRHTALGWDRRLPYPVVRSDTRVLLPTGAVTERAAELLREHRATRVLFGAAAPLGLMAPALRRAGAERIVGLTHGHEVWWASVPAARSRLRRIGDGCDVLTTISDAAAARIAPALSPAAGARLVRLAPPVDPAVFRPAPRVDGPWTCVAVGRLVPRKGFDTLIDAWARLDVPAGARLVIVGDGPQRGRLERLIRRRGLSGSVRLTGALRRDGVRAALEAADVFALPANTRLGGLDPEGLGLAAIEAAACGLPVVVGDSGGAPETVVPEQTGLVVDGRDPSAVAAALQRLHDDPARAASMGAAGRAFVTGTFGVDRARATLRTVLDLD